MPKGENVKHVKNVNENIGFWHIDVKNVKHVSENTGFWHQPLENLKKTYDFEVQGPEGRSGMVWPGLLKGKMSKM